MVLIFDYDGTLHNTKRLYGSAFRRAYKMLVCNGFAPERFYSDDEVSVYLGVSAPDMWNCFMPQLPGEWKQKASLMIGAEMIRGIEAGEAKLYDHIPAVLDQLKQEGYTMVILSNCRHGYMEAHRKAFGLDQWFTGYYCAEDYGFIPKEEIFSTLAGDHPHEHFIMIGDRASDLAVGAVHGFPFIGCLYGFGSEQELAAGDHRISSPLQLPELCRSISKTISDTPA